MKKNIVGLIGRDTYGISLEVQKWRNLFTQKYTSTNIDHFSLSELRNQSNIWKQNMLSGGLFSEKRLFIISGGNEKRDKTTDYVEFFSDIFSILPGDHTLLFHSLTERAIEVFDLIKQHGVIYEFDGVFSEPLWSSRFPEIDISAIKTVIAYFSQIEKLGEETDRNALLSHTIAGVFSSIENLALTQTIKKSDIEDILGDNGGGKTFDLVDAILAEDVEKSLAIFHRIAGTRSMFEFLPSLLGLLRNTLYIKYMIEYQLPVEHIKVHPYVLKKTRSSKIQLKNIQKFYGELVSASIAYKSGKGMKDVELGRILAIELCILGLKK